MSDNFSGNQYTEVTRTGYFSRLGGSIIAMMVGFVLIPGSIILLYWNEGRAVTAYQALSQGASSVVEAQPASVDAALNGKLVHLSGKLATEKPARDPIFGVSGDGLLRLKRSVEMYQWKESKHEHTTQSVGGSKETETTYWYERVWSETPIESSGFHELMGHRNPGFPIKSQSFNTDAAKLGAYNVDAAVLNGLSPTTTIPVNHVTPPSGYQVEGDEFYRGHAPSQPEIGDIRVEFTGLPSETVSFVAANSAGTLTPFHGVHGYTIALAKPGIVPAAELFAEKQHEENIWTWILRGIGFVLMLIAFLLIASPMTTLFAVLPFLEGIASAGAFIIALALSVPITLLTIAVAWIAHRPLLGILLIAGAIGSVALLRTLHRKPAFRVISA